ncbi:MAG: hypothetical protein QOD58_1096 [Mycobacterium sp.]|nr:hypothetical protein [Mycobacterium sp.]
MPSYGPRHTVRGSAHSPRQQIALLGQAAGALGRVQVVLASGAPVAKLIEQMGPHHVDAVMSAEIGVRGRLVELGKTGGRAATIATATVRLSATIGPGERAVRTSYNTPYGTVDGIRAWFATFDGPVLITYRDPIVSQDSDLAVVHTLAHMG